MVWHKKLLHGGFESDNYFKISGNVLFPKKYNIILTDSCHYTCVTIWWFGGSDVIEVTLLHKFFIYI